MAHKAAVSVEADPIHIDVSELATRVRTDNEIALTNEDVERILVSMDEESLRSKQFSYLAKRSRCISKTETWLNKVVTGGCETADECSAPADDYEEVHGVDSVMSRAISEAIRVHEVRRPQANVDEQDLEMDLGEWPTSVGEYPTTIRSDSYFDYFTALPGIDAVYREDNVISVAIPHTQDELLINNAMIYWSWDVSPGAMPTPDAPLCSRVLLVFKYSAEAGDVQLIQVQASALKQPICWPMSNAADQEADSAASSQI